MWWICRLWSFFPQRSILIKKQYSTTHIISMYIANIYSNWNANNLLIQRWTFIVWWVHSKLLSFFFLHGRVSLFCYHSAYSIYIIFLTFTAVLMFHRARVDLCASLYFSSITGKGRKLVEKKITVLRSWNVDHKEGKMTRPCVNCAFAFAKLPRITIIIAHLLWLNTCGKSFVYIGVEWCL